MTRLPLLLLASLLGCQQVEPCYSSARLLVDCSNLSGPWRVEWFQANTTPPCAGPPPRPEQWRISGTGGPLLLTFADAQLTGAEYEDHTLRLSGDSPSLGHLSLAAAVTTAPSADAGFVGAFATGTLRLHPDGGCSLDDGFRAERLRE